MILRKNNRLSFEMLESRRCLSAVTFVPAENDITSATISGATSVFAADLDGDGDMDVVSTASLAGNVAWYENLDGVGSFSSQRIIATQLSFAHDVKAADLDNDGDADLVVSSERSITWFENTDGRGSFGSAIIVTSLVNSGREIALSDIDGDGDIDVVSASHADDKIAWYENVDGTGVFGNQQVISNQVDGAESVFTADIDADGDLDVLSASENDNTIAWYENIDGNGRFGQQRIISRQASRAYSVQAADLDGDGDVDVISASGNDHKVAWYENIGGSFGVAPLNTERQISTSEVFVNSVYAADVDGDGDTDVLSAASNRLAWHENIDGRGTFLPPQLILSEVGSNSNGQTIRAADIDSDGDLDVISSIHTRAKIAWHENTDGRGAFGQQQLIAPQALTPFDVYSADLDGDGDADVLSASLNDNKIAWYENVDGRGTFGSQRVIAISNAQDGTYTVLAADFDMDGDFDVVSGTSKGVVWYENTDGVGTFGMPRVITLEPIQSVSHVADIDGDGDPDLISASGATFNATIAWYENTDGLGTFGPKNVITSDVSAVFSVFATDIDEDGDVDVLSASYSDDKIAWYENTDGLGTFGPQLVISNDTSRASSVFGADIDGDGDIDVLSASIDDNKIAWYRNTDGRGTFGPQNVITTASIGARSVYAADLDGDGDTDVISGSNRDDKIAWYENIDGRGTFLQQRVISTRADVVNSLFVQDLDGDGDLDVLSASSGDNKIAWYENRVPGDSNDDGVFNSTDLIKIFQANEYEDDIPNNSTFDEGDWNLDGDFDSSDLVFAFQARTYIAQSTSKLSRIASAIDFVFGKPESDKFHRTAFVV